MNFTWYDKPAFQAHLWKILFLAYKIYVFRFWQGKQLVETFAPVSKVMYMMYLSAYLKKNVGKPIKHVLLVKEIDLI